MTTKQIDCDDRVLQMMLHDELSEADAEGLLDHVEVCQRCQQRLDELSASSDEWQKAAEVLAVTLPEPEQLPTVFLKQPGEHHAKWTESMARQLLSPPSHPEMLGRLGRYDVERLIGAGGMGVVFKAFDTELNRPVAVKILAPYLAGNGPARQRFAREARAAAAVVHQHVVPIHNVETDHETPFLVMHYVAGESLQSRVDREGALELREILRIGMQVASGLAAAHQQGLVHRDIKPSNILLEDDTVERALITDFGLARASNDATVTHTGAHLGTPQYMSPEQAHGESVGQQSDLFSFGSVLYTMCIGRPPFRADTPYGIIRRIADEEPKPIGELNPDIPTWLCDIVQTLMSKRKEDRYASAAEVHELLEGCLSHVQQPGTNPLPAMLVKARPGRLRHVRTGLLTALAGFLFMLAGVVYYIQTNYGVVKVDVRDPSLNVTIAGRTVTMTDGNNTPMTITAGEKTLVVQQGDTKLETKSFQIRRGDNEIAFRVELVAGQVVVNRNDEPFDSLSLPQQPAVPDDTHAQEVATTPTPPIQVDELTAVGRTGAHCKISGSFTKEQACFWIENPQAAGRNVAFHYQIIFRNSQSPEDIFQLKAGEIRLEIMQNAKEVRRIDLLPDPNTSMPANYIKDRIEIRIANKPLDTKYIPIKPGEEPYLMKQAVTIASWPSKSLGWQELNLDTPGAPGIGGIPLENPSPHGSTIASVEFSPDQKSILTASSGLKSTYVTAVADGRRFTEMGGGTSKEHSVRLWDAKTGEQKLRLDHPAGVKATFLADGKQILSATQNRITWWHAETGERLSSMAVEGAVPWRTRFTPNRRFVIVMHRSKTASLWDLVKKEQACEYYTAASLEDQFSSDGSTFYSISHRGTFRGWPIENTPPDFQETEARGISD